MYYFTQVLVYASQSDKLSQDALWGVFSASCKQGCFFLLFVSCFFGPLRMKFSALCMLFGCSHRGHLQPCRLLPDDLNMCDKRFRQQFALSQEPKSYTVCGYKMNHENTWNWWPMVTHRGISHCNPKEDISKVHREKAEDDLLFITLIPILIFLKNHLLPLTWKQIS